MRRRTFLFLLFWPTAARAHSYKVNGVSVGHAWALPAAAGVDGQVFLPILNQNTEADALVAARSDICTSIELRQNARYDDPSAKHFDLAPGKPLPMRPSARHLRLIGLKKPLVKGDRFTLVLDLRHAGEIEVEVQVGKEGGH